MTNHVLLREYIERIITENNLRRDDQRMEDAKALKLIAEQTKAALEAYPTLRDFNALKNRVDIIVTLFQVLTGLAGIAGAVSAFLIYAK